MVISRAQRRSRLSRPNTVIFQGKRWKVEGESSSCPKSVFLFNDFYFYNGPLGNWLETGEWLFHLMWKIRDARQIIGPIPNQMGTSIDHRTSYSMCDSLWRYTIDGVLWLPPHLRSTDNRKKDLKDRLFLTSHEGYHHLRLIRRHHSNPPKSSKCSSVPMVERWTTANATIC